jgi:hypothetical protein
VPRPFETLESTIRSTEAAIAGGDLDTALRAIRAQVEGWLAAAPLTRNAIWGSRELDALASRIGRLVAELPPATLDRLPSQREASRPLDVYLFTKTEVGGHVFVAGDFVRAAPERESVVVLTEQPVVPVPPAFAERFATSPDRIICLPRATSLLEQSQMVISVLRMLQPDRIFAFNHHQDVSIVAAAGSGAVPAQTYYVHHGDFLPALGVYLSGTTHVDLTPRAHTFCNSVLALSPAYAPLVVEDRGRRPSSAPVSEPPVLATCGSPAKYDLSYKLPYHEVAAALLAQTSAILFHIGVLYDEQLAAVHEALRAKSVDESRWRHLPVVESVWDTLRELGVDLYLNSFPQRGGRVAVEVMGSGTPAVWHVTASRNRSVDLHLAYPEALAWSDVSELVAIVRDLDYEWIQRQRDASRAHYERVHHPSILAAIVADGFRSAPPAAPDQERLFAFEFEHLERSWHRLTDLIPPEPSGE